MNLTVSIGAVRTGYSGRDMGEATCFGVVMDIDDVTRFFTALDSVVAETRVGLRLDDTRIDDIGRFAAVVYFPGWTLQER